MTELQADPAEIEKRVSCVLWHAETRNETSVQRRFSSKFKMKPPHRSTIKVWFDAFVTTENVFARKSGSGRPREARNDGNVDTVLAMYDRSPTKSTLLASAESCVSQSLKT